MVTAVWPLSDLSTGANSTVLEFREGLISREHVWSDVAAIPSLAMAQPGTPVSLRGGG